MTTIQTFISDLVSLDIENTFNPYSDICHIHDKPNAAENRAKILSEILNIAEKDGTNSFWVGRDLGHRGGRRTGLALTDETRMNDHLKRWGLNSERFTSGEPVSERTATVIWSELNQIKKSVFLWNVFPLHPHEKDNPFTNRAHNKKERDIGIELFSSLISILKPKTIIGIGNDAYNMIKTFDTYSNSVYKVRHPSYGGHKDFISQIRSIEASNYSLK